MVARKQLEFEILVKMLGLSFFRILAGTSETIFCRNPPKADISKPSRSHHQNHNSCCDRVPYLADIGSAQVHVRFVPKQTSGHGMTHRSF
jgi:hypothetical protein